MVNVVYPLLSYHLFINFTSVVLGLCHISFSLLISTETLNVIIIMKPPRELFSLMEALELIHVTTYPFHLMWICKSNPVGLPPFCYKLQHTGNCRGRKTTWVSPSTLLRQCLLFTMLCRGGGLGASGDFLASTTLVAEECWGVRVLRI